MVMVSWWYAGNHLHTKKLFPWDVLDEEKERSFLL